jgi:hypothetical protein
MVSVGVEGETSLSPLSLPPFSRSFLCEHSYTFDSQRKQDWLKDGQSPQPSSQPRSRWPFRNSKERQGQYPPPIDHFSLQSYLTNPGPLSFIGDPLGHVLRFALSPFGYVLKAIGNPNGEALLEVQRQAARELKYIDDEEGKKQDREMSGGKRIGGNEQTGGNTLGV